MLKDVHNDDEMLLKTFKALHFATERYFQTQTTFGYKQSQKKETKPKAISFQTTIVRVVRVIRAYRLHKGVFLIHLKKLNPKI